MSTERNHRLARLNAAFLFFGVALLIWMVVRLDVGVIWSHVKVAGWVIAPAFLAAVASQCVGAMSWRETLDPGTRRPSVLTMVQIQWAGNAVNSVTPGGVMGEMMKGATLARELETEEVASSLVIYTYFSLWTMVLMNVVGPLLCLILLPELPVGLLLSLLGISLVIAAGMFFVRRILRRGAASKFARLLVRLPLVRIRNPDRLAERANLVDSKVRQFRSERPGAFARAILLSFAARLFMMMEAWLLIMVLMPDRSAGWALVFALLVQTANRFVQWAAWFVPDRVGVSEGGVALLFQLATLSPATGLALGLLRRGRRIVGVIIGLLLGLPLIRAAKGQETES